MGNYHAQFLGGLGLATAPGYPVLIPILALDVLHVVQHALPVVAAFTATEPDFAYISLDLSDRSL